MKANGKWDGNINDTNKLTVVGGNVVYIYIYIYQLKKIY